MDRRILLGIAVTLAFIALPAGALAQAAAESALTTAGSATQAIKAGSGLNQNSNQLLRGVQQGISKSLPDKTQRNQQEPELKRQAGTEAPRDPVPEPAGPLPISVQGAEVTCASADKKAETPESKTDAASTKCRSKGPSVKPGLQDKYKPVVDLSF